MLTRLLARFTYANVMSTLAVFLLLGGGAYAATTLAANSVGSRELKNGAVGTAEVNDRSLTAKDFAAGQLPAGAPGAPGRQGSPGPAGADACDDGLLCPDTDLPDGQTVKILIDGYAIVTKPAYRIDCGPTAATCGLSIGGPATSNLDLDLWHQAVLQGDVSAKKSFSLVVYDAAGTPVRRYHVTNGYPKELNEDGTRVEAVFVTEGIQRVAP